jgi:hypothetical protein
MQVAIAKKHATFGSKLKLSGVIGPKIRPNSASKRAKESVVWWRAMKMFIGCSVVDNFGRQPIDQKHSGEEGLVPIF